MPNGFRVASCNKILVCETGSGPVGMNSCFWTQSHCGLQTFVGVFRGRSLLPEARQEERQTSSSEPDPGEPFLPPFANVPRQSRSRIRRQRRQIARPIDADLDAPSRSVSNAEDTTIGDTASTFRPLPSSLASLYTDRAISQAILLRSAHNLHYQPTSWPDILSQAGGPQI